MKELRTLLPYLRPYRRGIIGGLALVALANAFAIAAPALLGLAIDAMGRPGVTGGVILGYAALVVLAAAAAGSARFGMRHLLNGISRRIEVDLRDALFDHLLRLDTAFFGRMPTGDLMSRATNDTQAVRMAAGPAVMYLVNTVVMTAFALALMLRISPALTAAALVPLAFVPPVSLVFGRAIHRRFIRIQDHLGVLSTLVQENLSGARIVRAYRQEDAQAEEFDQLNTEYLRRNMALASASAAFHPLLTLLTGAGMVIVLWIGGTQAMAGRISIGDFVAFGFYVAMLTWPMIALGWVINLFQRGAASMGRLNAIFAARPLVGDAPDPRRLAAVRGRVEFRDVHFRYPGSERQVLHGVTFRIDEGSTVAIVGPTGSGKSTIVKLLTRMYEPDRGSILIDGEPLPELSLEQVRAAIGVVPQDAFVFSETIADNIAIGIPRGATEDGRIEAAAAIARLDETIAAFPNGYRTRLGERGVNLSGGQRQRTTLARALARDPRILALDDALSAVDSQTETEILRALRRVLDGRTAVIISHRVTAVMGADLILVVEDGRITERGTHPELLERDGLYAALLRRQLLTEDLEGDAALTAAAATPTSAGDP